MKHGNSATTACMRRIITFSIFAVFHGLTTKSGAAQTRVSLQPFAQHVRQVETSLAYLGQPLDPSDHEAINQAIADPDEAAAVARLEQILDKYTLVIADISPESRVKVQSGAAKAELVEDFCAVGS
jgi:hypothetical protein